MLHTQQACKSVLVPHRPIVIHSCSLWWGGGGKVDVSSLHSGGVDVSSLHWTKLTIVDVSMSTRILQELSTVPGRLVQQMHLLKQHA